MGLVMRRLLNAEELAAWARAQGFRDLVPSAWHVTVINSRGPMSRKKVQLEGGELSLPASSSRCVGPMGDFVVLVFASLELRKRNAALRLAGADGDYRQYRPHVTFSVSRRRNLRSVQPFTGPLMFGPEVMGSDWWDAAAEDAESSCPS